MASRLERAPVISAEAGEDLMTLKHGRTFLCSSWSGDIEPGPARGGGLYLDDTRYLSELRLEVGGRSPLVLTSSAARAYEAVVDMTNPAMEDLAGAEVPQMALGIRRRRVLDHQAHERVELHNYAGMRARVEVRLTLAADFADVFQIRGVRERASSDGADPPRFDGGEVCFSRVGSDAFRRDTVVTLDPPPEDREVDGTQVVLRWDVDLEPGAKATITATIQPAPGGVREPVAAFERAAEHAAGQAERWRARCAGITTDHPSFDHFVEASVRDLGALRTPEEGGEILAGGIPWYVAPFGRDSLITCHEILLLNPEPARQTLRYLAARQATEDDPARDAEPGKILHEERFGELARSGQIPHTPYYGSVDSTPLFLMLAAEYHRWTGDLELMSELRPNLDAALKWIDDFGDLDGDGLVEYRRRSPAGLENQGWKDSEDAIVHLDGTLAQPPVALVEVQAYVFRAKRLIAEVYEALGEPDRGGELRAQARALCEAFEAAFWMPDEGFYAMALDGQKRQVRSISSNPGHALACGIVAPDRATAVAERLLAEDMMSGWGIRTLSSGHPSYNPMSYHTGSVWPHDNAIAAAGLKRYGFAEAAERIATAMFDVAVGQRDFRLPELFCGFRRRADVPVVSYPVACRPQAWAAGALFALLQSMLGVTARAGESTLRIEQPAIPSWLGSVELRGVRVGSGRVSLRFTSAGGVTSSTLLEREGDVRVTLRA
jgi:glycogen debranching enzyme